MTYFFYFIAAYRKYKSFIDYGKTPLRVVVYMAIQEASTLESVKRQLMEEILMCLLFALTSELFTSLRDAFYGTPSLDAQWTFLKGWVERNAVHVTVFFDSYNVVLSLSQLPEDKAIFKKIAAFTKFEVPQLKKSSVFFISSSNNLVRSQN